MVVTLGMGGAMIDIQRRVNGGLEVRVGERTTANVYQGKAKRKQWQKVVDEGISQEDAEKKYIELGEKLIAAHHK
jgi:diazepam-binding inhibitor (GABA receptor modulating acyl-CoA-binding protein)